jgi:hypothetical protein
MLAVLFSLVAATAPMAVSAKAPPVNCPNGSSGMVFFLNPVASLGGAAGQALTDQKDADYDLLNNQRVSRPLTGLDGSGYLRGTWAVVINEVGQAAYETDCTYEYTRHDDRFEQVMAYYWTTRSQDYLHALGFDGGSWPLINGDQQQIRINQWGIDNSMAVDKPKDEMRFGKGGVDDAEDADIILHELGHQIHFSQSPDGFSSSAEADAIGEGFGDYWAGTVGVWAGGPGDPKCIGDWDAVSYTTDTPHCLRRLDANLMYPDDFNGRIHHDGMVWSQALWDLRTAIGATQADTAILWAQFGWVGTTMPELAQRIVDEVIAQGNGQGGLACAAFENRGILTCD